MPVTQTTDTELLVETARNPCVILKYHTDDCGDPCDQLVPVFEQLSSDPNYDQIVFLKINADSNPVAKNFIMNRLAPIITIYHNGRLVESRSATSKDEIVNMLNLLVNERDKI